MAEAKYQALEQAADRIKMLDDAMASTETEWESMRRSLALMQIELDEIMRRLDAFRVTKDNLSRYMEEYDTTPLRPAMPAPIARPR